MEEAASSWVVYMSEPTGLVQTLPVSFKVPLKNAILF